MKDYISHNEWCIIEDGFHPEHNEITESLMSLGNGRMGSRGNFEEKFTGKTLQGNYIAGVWFPDKTRVGWWKNGYPNYFAKVINAVNWVGFDVSIDGVEIDMAKNKILSFKRTLNMKEGTLKRVVILELEGDKQVEIETMRFCSMAHDEAGAVSYAITPLNFDGNVTMTAFLDGDVSNKDSNHGETFWDEIDKETQHLEGCLTVKTKQSPWETVPTFHVASAMKVRVFRKTKKVDVNTLPIKKEKYVGQEFSFSIQKGEKTVVQKYVANLSSENHAIEDIKSKAKAYAKKVYEMGFEDMLAAHINKWENKWAHNDIEIKGDVAAQQGIRFNIFHLQQTYTGEDARLNIGPKGFTGEKYGGVTYWDTEAYCLPFYLATSEPSVAKNLLVYRHNHLQKAIENAALLGFDKGAALYPMVTMNGEECHNEWEITFEEIHRNGAIAHAIFDYIRYTGDQNYLPEYGLEVLISISRFWAQRVNWSTDKDKYVMLGVTGPNEYENNINNNWYTNQMAVWTLKYTQESIAKVHDQDVDRLNAIKEKLNFKEAETEKWNDIIEKMHFPYDEERKVFLQQDGFLDKDLLSTDQITEHRPINQKWSWDRILRSCFIKQADVLQGIYFLEDDFTLEELERNFDFYEPMTVHESSLSPCIHTILACKLGRLEKAYEMYVRTARLDIDDYNNDTEDGLHITSMAGTWLAVVKGFGGMKVTDEGLSFDPKLPVGWDSYRFKVGHQGKLFEVHVSESGYEVIQK